MPASRWNSSILDMIHWLYENDIGLDELLLQPVTPLMQKQGEAVSAEQTDDPENEKSGIPDVLPILPLRGLVVYPQTAVPLTIGQARSIRLVDDVMDGDERMIGLVASRNPELETPGPDELYRVGCVAMVHRMFRAPDGTIRLVVQGIARFELGEFVQEEPYLKAHIRLAPEVVEEGVELEALARNARSQFERIAELIPSIPRELVASVLALDDPLQTVYTIANFQRMDLEDAQELLQLESATEKLHKLTGILAHELEILEIGQKIQNEARSEIEKVQREYFLREQLKAIQRELGEGDEQTAEVEEFRKKIEGGPGPPRTGAPVAPAHRCCGIRGDPHLPGLAGLAALVEGDRG